MFYSNLIGGSKVREVEPIRDKSKIDKMKQILKKNSVRDYLLFTLGINSGLRISDLLELRVQDILSMDGKVKKFVEIQEKKTGKTKKFAINKTTEKAIKDYIKEYEISPAEDKARYVFKSRKGNNRPINRTQAWKIINEAGAAAGIQSKVGTHTLRKTFGNFAYKNGVDLSLLQKIFNHSSPGITLRYIGIVQEEIDEVYVNMNL